MHQYFVVFILNNIVGIGSELWMFQGGDGDEFQM